MIPNTSAIYIHRSFGYEKINEPRIENQAFIFVSEHHFKTTSIFRSFTITQAKKNIGFQYGRHLFSKTQIDTHKDEALETVLALIKNKNK